MPLPSELRQVDNDLRPHFLNQVLALPRVQMKLRSHPTEDARIGSIETVPSMGQHGIGSEPLQTLFQEGAGILEQDLFALVLLWRRSLERGLHGALLSARGPSAGAAPGRWGACLAVRTPPAALREPHRYLC